MSRSFISIRALLVILAAGFLAACTQTGSGVSTFSGNLSVGQQQAKILAARKRAAKQRIKRKEEFRKKRDAAKAKRSTKASRTALRTKKRKARKVSAKVSTKRVSKKRVKFATKKRRKNAGKIVKVKTRSIKGTKYAYVGGRSRGIKKRAPWRCVPKRMKIVLNQVSKKFGRVTINSTHRSSRHNRRVGGKRRSYHLRCRAVDFRVHGRTRGLTRWLARHPYVGGYNRYPSGYYHIDTGPKRTW